MVQSRSLDRNLPTAGIILLGNTGAGKSFLANVLLQDDVFKHEFSADSVTHVTESREFKFYGRPYVIFNVPGLTENNQEAIQRNKTEIQKAFEQHSFCIVVPVFNVGGEGRLHDEDLVVFNDLNDAYRFQPESLMFIINNLRSDRPKLYEDETIRRLEEVLKMKKIKICFVEQVNTKNMAYKGILRSLMLQTMADCTPSIHRKHGDILLPIDKLRKLEEEVNRKKAEFDARRKELEYSIKQQQKEYESSNKGWCIIL